MFLNDTFTDTDGTILTAHTGEVGATWANHAGNVGQWSIASNRAYCSTGGVVYASGVPSSPDYIVEADVRNLSSGQGASILARVDPSAMTFYMFRHYGGTAWQLHRCVGGTFTLLDSLTASLTVDTTYRYKLSVNGDQIQGSVDDTVVCEATDANVTAAGRVGFRDGTVTTTTGKHIDRIWAYHPAPTRIFSVLKIGTNQRIGPLRVG